jgi:hypothetical protein
MLVLDGKEIGAGIGAANAGGEQQGEESRKGFNHLTI